MGRSPGRYFWAWFSLKATATVPHGGGEQLAKNDPKYQILAAWIAQGAPTTSATTEAAMLERIEVYPAQWALRRGATQPLLVEAFYSDGSMADVTELAEFIPNDELIASVSDTGLVEATGSGERVVVARLLGHVAVSRMIVSQEASTPFPVVKPNNRIDELVLAKLTRLNIRPSELASDAEFLRRIYLDVSGTLPSPAVARRFLADSDPFKHDRLIDELLERPEFTDRWTLKWCELLRVNRSFPVYLRDKPMWAYYRWVRMPWDLGTMLSLLGINYEKTYSDRGRNIRVLSIGTSVVSGGLLAELI